jgi:membrane-associated protease RseP (regulator of RpoE activity)
MVLAAVLFVSPAAAEEDEGKKVDRQVYIFSSGGSWLGVSVGDIDADRAAELGLDEAAGAEIQSVAPDSPAAEAGLAEGDIILKFQGTRIEGVRQLTRMVRETPAGRIANLQVFSGGSTRMVQVKVAKREQRWETPLEGEEPDMEHFELPGLPEVPEISIPPIEIPEIDLPGVMLHHWLPPSDRLGIVVDELNEQLGAFFGVEGGKGVLVRSVVKDSRAEAAGIKAGDVIVEINDAAIADSSDLRLALRERRGESVKLTVVRDKRQQRITVAAPEKKKGGESGSGEFIWHEDEGKEERIDLEKSRGPALEARRALREAWEAAAQARLGASREQRLAREEIRRAVEMARRLRDEARHPGFATGKYL